MSRRGVLSNRASPQPSEAASEPPVASPPNRNRWAYVALVIALFIIPSVSILLYRFKYSEPDVSLVESQIIEPGGLIKIGIDYQEILRENTNTEENATLRHYTYPSLAFVTPWNSKGYEMAKRYAHKFTYVSPVWYDLKSHGGKLVLEGRHNVDQNWMSDVRNRGNSRILPRIVLDAEPKEILRSEELKQKATDIIVSECREMNYDGIVFESWSRWLAYGVLYDPQLRDNAIEFVKSLGRALHAVSGTVKKLEFVYVIAPPYSDKLQAHDFGPEDLRKVNADVDGFSLMTYDFSGPPNPGPNAPFEWIQSTLLLLVGNDTESLSLCRKILVGINFYGNDFVISGESGGGAITGREYLGALAKFRPQMEWEEVSKEHVFFYVDDDGSRHVVFYPSLMSIYVRLELARSHGTGLSIWEIGQGLDYFFDLL